MSKIQKSTTYSSGKLPLIQHPGYKIGLSVLQSWHPFDLDKSGRVRRALVEKGLVSNDQFTAPQKITDAELRTVHTQAYLDSLKDPDTLAAIFQVEALRHFPAWLTNYLITTPMRYQAGGTILAGQMAAEHGWAINLGGGMHHASAEMGSGFCIYDDIAISIKKLRAENPSIRKVMIVDLDAHQGNGYERDFMNDPGIYVLDAYTHIHEWIEGAKPFYPNDIEAMAKINYSIQLEPYTEDADYFKKLSRAFNVASYQFSPDIIYYVAGTDILEGDKVGRQSISREGVIRRDEMVFEFAKSKNIPVVMVFGGGYQMNNAPLIADSIENLDRKFGLFKPKP